MSEKPIKPQGTMVIEKEFEGTDANTLTFGNGSQFGMRPSSENQVKARATGSRLVQYEKFLVKLNIVNVPPPYPGLPASSKLVGGQIGEKTGESKLEPHLVYGNKVSLAQGVMGFNQMFILDAKVPVQLWFPKGAVSENQKIKATQIEILIKPGREIYNQKFYFFEYKGGKTLDEQIAECKNNYEYTPEL